jgi:hypothetical protein
MGREDGWTGERCGWYSKGHIIIEKRDLCNGLFEVRNGVVWYIWLVQFDFVPVQGKGNTHKLRYRDGNIWRCGIRDQERKGTYVVDVFTFAMLVPVRRGYTSTLLRTTSHTPCDIYPTNSPPASYTQAPPSPDHTHTAALYFPLET